MSTVNNNDYRPQMPQLTSSEQSLVDKAKSEMGTDSSAAAQDLASAQSMFESSNSGMSNAGQAFGMAVDGYERSQGTPSTDMQSLNSLLPSGDEPQAPPGGWGHLGDGNGPEDGMPPGPPPDSSTSSSTNTYSSDS